MTGSWDDLPVVDLTDAEPWRDPAGSVQRLVAEGHRVRIYVPYGQKWYEYSLRRLQENPALAGMIARETVLRAVPGRD